MKAKKLLSLLFAMIMLFSITACSEAGGDPEEPKVTVYLTTKCVDESGVSTTYEYDDAGNMVKSAKLSADGGEIMRSEWVYDGAGNKIEEKQFSNGEYVGSYKYTYDQKNHISSEVFYDEDGVEFSRSEYQCDDSGNVIEEKISYEGELSSFYKYEYDAAGNRTKWLSVKNDTEIPVEEEEYDSNGNLIKYVSYSNGQERERDEYKYDSAGNRTEVVSYKNGKEDSRRTYEYDGNGNQIKWAHLEDGYESSQECKYDSNGNMTERVLYNGDTESSRYNYTYNSAGLLATEEEIYSDGTGNNTAFTYDEAGNLLKEERTSTNGQVYTRSYTYVKIMMTKSRAEKLQEAYGENALTTGMIVRIAE